MSGDVVSGSASVPRVSTGMCRAVCAIAGAASSERSSSTAQRPSWSGPSAAASSVQVMCRSPPSAPVVVPGALSLAAGQCPHGQGLDAGHRCPFGVGDVEADGTGGRRRCDAYAYGGGSGRVQGDAAPQERDVDAVLVLRPFRVRAAGAAQCQRAQGGVEESRVDAVAVRCGEVAFRQPYVEVQLLAEAPGRVQSPEGGAVGEAAWWRGGRAVPPRPRPRRRAVARPRRVRCPPPRCPGFRHRASRSRAGPRARSRRPWPRSPAWCTRRRGGGRRRRRRRRSPGRAGRRVPEAPVGLPS